MTDQLRKLGRWRLGEKIAETAHSVVWHGTDDAGAEAAVKELRVRNPEKEPYLRFRDEVSFLLEHGDREGVLPLVDADTPEVVDERGPAWLAMPLARTMPEALGDGPSLADVVGAVAACASTLADLANEGVFHRDLKPNNLFELDRAWLVGDFGIATWPGKQALTEPGQKLGPAHFIAPEMVEDPATAAPGPADVWSLAKTLWVLAVGQNFPPPGTLRADQPATSLRANNLHERAYVLEPILERATMLDPAQRPTMRVLADELAAWSAPPVEPATPADLDDLERRVAAITAPAASAEEARLVRDRKLMLLFERLRDSGVHRLYGPMERLGRVHIEQQSLILQGLGGGSGRRDAIETAAESLTLSPLTNHRVSLTADVAYELFDDDLVHIVAGLYVRTGDELPQVVWIGKSDVPLGTELAAQAADEVVNELIVRFADGAARFTELLEAAEAQAQRNRQPLLESEGANYLFRTEPSRAGSLEILDKNTGARDGYTVAWHGTPFEEIRAEGDRLYVRAGDNEGWITRSDRGQWALSDSSRAIDEDP